MAKKELAVIDKFEIVSPVDGMDEELREEFMDEMEDFDDDTGIDCRKIKIPHGGIAFEVEGDDPDDAEPMKTVEGVIVFTHRMNSYWAGAFAGESEEAGNRMPDCSSYDGQQGVHYETGEIRNCDTCPFNQFGADGSGKACKNMRRFYIMMSGRPMPYLLSIPPTSLKNVNFQMKRIMGSTNLPYAGMVVAFKLEKAANKNGVAYSKVNVSLAGKLTPDQMKKTVAMRNELKKKYKEVAITASDYNTVQERPPVVDEGAFMEVPDAADLPFN